MADGSIRITGDAAAEPTEAPSNTTESDTGVTARPGEAPASERPAWLPEKFKSAEDLAKAYGELEKKLGSRSNTDDGDVPAPKAPEAANKPSGELPKMDNTANKQPAKVTLSMAAAEYGKNGSVSAESYAALETAGLTRAEVDTFIAGTQAASSAFATTVADAVGGADELRSLVQWASANADPQVQAAYNKAVDEGNAAVASMIVKGLHAEYAEAVGSDGPGTVVGKANVGKTGAQPFRSQGELTAAMGDKRYATDAAYRADVMARLAVTEMF